MNFTHTHMNEFTISVLGFSEENIRFPVYSCSADEETSGVVLRVLDLAAMLYAKKGWTIEASPLIPESVVWVSVLCPAILDIWRAWTNRRAAGAGATTMKEVEEGDTDEEQEEGDDFGVWLPVEGSDNSRHRNAVADYYAFASKMWRFYINKKSADHVKYMAAAINELRSRFDWQRTAVEAYRELMLERRFGEDTNDDSNEAEIQVLMQKTATATEQMKFLRSEIDRLRRTVTDCMGLNSLLILGNVYPENAELKYDAYVIWL